MPAMWSSFSGGCTHREDSRIEPPLLRPQNDLLEANSLSLDEPPPAPQPNATQGEEA